MLILGRGWRLTINILVSMKLVKKIVNSNDLKIVLVAVLYFIAAQIGIWLSYPGTATTILWPPAGLALALILISGYRTWPAITIGALIANVFWPSRHGCS